MLEEDPDDTPEYYRAKQEWIHFWKHIRDGLEKGRDDDPVVAVAGLVQQFNLHIVEEALERYVENLPMNFEARWRGRHEARLRREEQARQRARNPNNAGRKPQRSDPVLLGAWLIVQRSMRLEGLTAVDACKRLVKPPSRREASGWLGLLLYRDNTVDSADSRPYYVKTPETLRDIYNDAVKRYTAGPERLRRHWEAQLEHFLSFPG
jgi:hypothetical protein